MIAIVSRPARFDLNVPLSFKTDDGLEEGHCVNVSASGMLAVFNKAVELFTTGEVSLLIGEYYINITARVARVQNGDHGLAFHIETDNDRNAIQIMLDYASAQHQPA